MKHFLKVMFYISASSAAHGEMNLVSIQTAFVKVQNVAVCMDKEGKS